MIVSASPLVIYAMFHVLIPRPAYALENDSDAVLMKPRLLLSALSNIEENNTIHLLMGWYILASAHRAAPPAQFPLIDSLMSHDSHVPPTRYRPT